MATKSEEPRCPCGHDRNHYMVSPSPDHGVGGWFKLLIGISTRPTRITYVCRRCDTTIAETTAPEVLDALY